MGGGTSAPFNSRGVRPLSKFPWQAFQSRLPGSRTLGLRSWVWRPGCGFELRSTAHPGCQLSFRGTSLLSVDVLRPGNSPGRSGAWLLARAGSLPPERSTPQRICLAYLFSSSRPCCTRSSSCSFGGDEGTRTPDPRLAKAVLSQLSYIPVTRESGPDWTRTSDPCVISTVL